MQKLRFKMKFERIKNKQINSIKNFIKIKRLPYKFPKVKESNPGLFSFTPVPIWELV